MRTTNNKTKYVKLTILGKVFGQCIMNEGSSSLTFVENGIVNQLLTNNQILLKNLSLKQSETLKTLVNNKPFSDSLIDLLNASELTLSSNRATLINEYEVRYKNRFRSLRIDGISVDNTYYLNLALNNQLNLEGVSEFLVIIYVEDVSTITNLTLSITGTKWERTPIETLTNGWNILRFQTVVGDLSSWVSAGKIRLNFYTNNSTKVYLSDIFAVKPQKAKILFINDHGYHNFKEFAYPKFKELGIPITWAINPGRLGATVSSVESILTQQDIEELSYDYFSEFTIHNWNPTSTMSEAELLNDTHKCLTYLKKNGILPRYVWRGAFTQNDAPNHSVLQPYLDAYASWKSSAGIELFPFRDRYNINRVAVHGASRDNAYYDGLFLKLKKTHSLVVCYTHGIDDAGDIHMTNSQLNYFIEKCREGIEGGWLEGTTYLKLIVQYNFKNYIEVL